MTGSGRWRRIGVLLLVLGALGAGCGRGGGEQRSTEPITPSPFPHFPGGTTMARIQLDGVLKVGVSSDRPGFGAKNPETGQFEGLEVEIAKLVALPLFGLRDLEDAFHRVAFEEVALQDRQRLITDGSLDVVIAGYAIDETGQQDVGFAGPYWVGSHGIGLRADDAGVNGAAQLNGAKVCTVRDSGSEKMVRDALPGSAITVLPSPADCGQALKWRSVRAVVADLPVLVGIVKASHGAFKLAPSGLGEQPYGIGLRKDDGSFRDFLNDRLEQILASGEWAAAFDRTLGAAGLARPPPPKLRR